jgi:nucleoside-diphosphate-sugar epimerase
MRVFIAGATGTMGMPLVHRLIREGHAVIGLTRKEEGASRLRRAGAEAAIGDALDRDRLHRLVADARPTHVVHLLTALPKSGATRAKDLSPTNALRIDGTAHLVSAALAAGAKRIIAESFPIVYGPADLGTTPLDEFAAMDPNPSGAARETVEALRSLESQLLAVRDRIETTVLRYGYLYGAAVPSTEFLLDGLRARKVPLIRRAGGLGSWLHIDDSVDATMAALQSRDTGVYNIVDDEPVSLTEFILHAARLLGAPQPRTLPRFVAKLAAPMLAQFASMRLPLANARAKRELGFAPRFANYRDGLAEVIAARERAA